MDRSEAERRDAADPLHPLREQVVDADPDLLYLDGNSLGRLPRRTVARLERVVRDEWGGELVRAWSHWIRLPRDVGDLIGRHLVGAADSQVVVADSTSVNLYRLAAAALAHRPDRGVVVTDDDNFPTDRYVLAGAAAERGRELRLLHTDPDEGVDPDALAAAVDDDVALVSLSHVAYRSGALADMAAVNEVAHRRGALVLWDLCHSAGAVPVELDAAGTDLAVGCTYKYLNGGPGSPAFLYVRRDLQARLANPVQGWFGQRDQFAMDPAYEPVADIGRFLVGTPPVLSVVAVEEGVRLLAEAGIDRLHEKAMALTDYLIALADTRLAGRGFEVASPRDPRRRGGHVTLHHPQAWQISQALVAEAKVVPDHRTPDRLRLGPAPLYTRFTDVWDAVDRLVTLVDSGAHETYPAALSEVT